jgi:AcrR family transcriptional regulator
MSTIKEHEARPATPGPQDSAKRRQILDGARRAFLEHGFDAASMGEVVSASGVSKATVYAYFESKEKLFEAMIFEGRRSQAEQIFSLDLADHDVGAVLTRLGTAYMGVLGHPPTCQVLRIVIAAATKFPEVGRAFYEAGPQYGRDRLAGYLDAQVRAGVLDIADTRVAALHFMELCKAGITLPMLLGIRSGCTSDEIERNVGQAVKVFLAAYGKTTYSSTPAAAS